jgi:DNA-binding SARP family transcriptional activator
MSIPAPRALHVKVVPPAVAPHLVDRPRLARRVAEARLRRLTVVTAPAGFGKSTLLSGLTAEQLCAWYTLTEEDADPLVLLRGLVDALRLRVAGLPDDLARALAGMRGPDAAPDGPAEAFVPVLAGALQDQLASDLVLVLDDVQEVTAGSPSARVVAELCRQAPLRLHLALSSRSDPPFPIERLRAQGHVLSIGGAELAFDAAEVAAALAAVAGPGTSALAGEVHDLTGGWPAGVRLIADALSAGDPSTWAAIISRSARSGGPVDRLVTDEVLGRASDQLAAVLRVGTIVDEFTAGLAAQLGVPAAVETLAAEVRQGGHVLPVPSREGWYTLTPLVREAARRRLPVQPDELQRQQRTAAAWYEHNGDPVAATRCLLRAGDAAGVARLLETAGGALLAAGNAALVADAAGSLPGDLRSAAIDLLEGEARQVRGDWAGAQHCLDRLVAGPAPVAAAVAWRLGLMHHLRGDLATALNAYRRGFDGPGDDRDRALLLAWAAAAEWLQGDREACSEHAHQARDHAERSGDDQAIAAAHPALARLAALDGDRRANDAHYLQALDRAERAGDVLQLVRIRSNRGSRYLEEGHYHEAVAELDLAVQLADLAGFAAFRALALVNRGEVLRRLGRLEEAERDLAAALSEEQRLGSSLASYPLGELGEVHLDRGDAALARSCFEEAIALAELSGDLQGLVPALAGLALVVAAEDAGRATELAEHAVSLGPMLGHQRALVAASRVALGAGDLKRAREFADRTAQFARSRRDRATLAEALELQAAVDPDQAAARRRARLEESLSLWRALDSPLGVARVELALARLAAGFPAVGNAYVLAGRAESTARRIGARLLAQEATALRAELAGGGLSEITVRTLGGFRVEREGRPVTPSAWQSRKARDLLKILVARRGSPLPRGVALDLLWPDDPPERAASRLSVTLSTLRAVLDPVHTRPADHYVVSGEGALWLRGEHLDIDVEHFLDLANRALALRAGAHLGAVELLEAAEAAYSGEFCAEDPYVDWAVPLREEARNSYLGVARALSDEYLRSGDRDAAVRAFFRLLAHDPYDEHAHLGLVRALVAAGRHGDARRAYLTYGARMTELRIEPAPFPTRDRVL